LTKLYTSRWQLAGAHGSQGTSAPVAFRGWRTSGFADTPVSQQVLTWLIFWPLLSLIARQAVYFTGPARSAGAYQNGAAVAGGRGAHYYLYVNLLFLFGFVLAGHRQILAVLKKNMLIVAMLALGVCSALWSASPKITLQMCIEVGLCTFFGCFLATRYTTERLMRLLMFMGAIAALLSIFFALALPNYGVFQGYAGHAWQGICNHKNTLGISMAFLLTPALFSQSYGRGRRLAYGVLLLFLVYMSQSRGAWFDTIGMLMFVGWLSLIRRVRGRELKLLLFFTATVGVASLALVVHFWPILATLIGKDSSMTGRTGIYTEVWRSVVKHPLLGYGFGGFWFPGSLESQRVGLALRWPNIGYSENGFLELALQTGFIGVGLLVAMLAKAVVQGIRLLRSPQYSPRIGWFLTILFLAALTNIDAGWFMTADTLDWALIVIACVGLNEEMGRLHEGREYSQSGPQSPLIQTCPS
jgi:exopolysaccharide production protein ExoQ